MLAAYFSKRSQHLPLTIPIGVSGAPYLLLFDETLAIATRLCHCPLTCLGEPDDFEVVPWTGEPKNAHLCVQTSRRCTIWIGAVSAGVGLRRVCGYPDRLSISIEDRSKVVGLVVVQSEFTSLVVHLAQGSPFGHVPRQGCSQRYVRLHQGLGLLPVLQSTGLAVRPLSRTVSSTSKESLFGQVTGPILHQDNALRISSVMCIQS